MILLLFGPPGCGKGTQAAYLAERFSIPAISTGEMFRAECKAGTDLGKIACELLSKGALVGDDIVNQMVARRVGQPDCKDVPWAGIKHMLVNHVIDPAPGGATGKVYLIAIGLDGEPGKVEAQGRYDDVYVKTPQGWRFKTRTHVLALNQTEVSRGSKPR